MSASKNSLATVVTPPNPQVNRPSRACKAATSAKLRSALVHTIDSDTESPKPDPSSKKSEPEPVNSGTVSDNPKTARSTAKFATPLAKTTTPNVGRPKRKRLATDIATNDQEVSEERPKKKTNVGFATDAVHEKTEAQVVKPSATRVTNRYGNRGRKDRTSSPVLSGVHWDDIPSALPSSPLAAVTRNLKSRTKVDQTVPTSELVELSASHTVSKISKHRTAKRVSELSEKTNTGAQKSAIDKAQKQTEDKEKEDNVTSNPRPSKPAGRDPEQRFPLKEISQQPLNVNTTKSHNANDKTSRSKKSSMAPWETEEFKVKVKNMSDVQDARSREEIADYETGIAGVNDGKSAGKSFKEVSHLKSSLLTVDQMETR
ncbi:hypothetical protein BD410DRAFT_429219 [Rickenella mellea]|uniref:Uncharacterized protein n=1 Tax=Rickenella mellea TaxID=50990 RepID=A0A4Y7QK38_9AGAM|nr:hypothetical protein BD410DRAFT_429219 [Rickenella mellea]